ncbi:cation:proton antiporter [Myxococcota bacterium]|nr:cation:proton antiporter [Myxococcota bacterium]
MHLDLLLADLAIVFLAGVLSVLALGRLGLPPVVGFLVAGLLIGPHALGLVDDPHVIEVMAELGVALLLFTIGLEFSLDRLRRIGRLVAVGGTLQVGLTVAAAVGGAFVLGERVSEGVFWGYLAALSSTAIVLRLLADRGELDAPHGRFVVGVLIFQDLCIVPMMLTVPLLGGQGASVSDLALVLGKAAAVVVGVVVGARIVVPRLLGLAARARSREVFVLTVLLVACAVAWATATMGLSIALGAFLAGIVVAETEFVHQVHSEVSPFRDALASLFFVSVGMLLDPSVLLERPVQVSGLVLLLVGGKLLLAALAVLLMRFPARVALLSGLSLAQVGEFSFVLLRAGEGAGIVDQRAAATFLAASVVTMIAAPLLVAWSPRLAAGARLLRPLERLLAVRQTEAQTAQDEPLRDHVVVAGMGLGGRTLVGSLRAARVPYVALELNPETVIAERAAGRNVRYGDVTSAEVLEQVACVAHARQVVLLLSDVEGARRAARILRGRFPHVPVLLRVHRLERDGAAVDEEGCQVIAEDHEAAVEIVERVLRATGASGALLAAAVAAARTARSDVGLPLVSAAGASGSLHVHAVTLAPTDHAVDQTLAGLSLRAETGALVVALGRDGQVLPSPGPHQALQAGDVVFLLGSDAQITAATGRLALGPDAAAPLPAAADPL